MYRLSLRITNIHLCKIYFKIKYVTSPENVSNFVENASYTCTYIETRLHTDICYLNNLKYLMTFIFKMLIFANTISANLCTIIQHS